VKYLTTAILFMLFACYQAIGNSSMANKAGVEKDAPGCFGSAGYIW
jgi:hypothetical protein